MKNTKNLLIILIILLFPIYTNAEELITSQTMIWTSIGKFDILFI